MSYRAAFYAAYGRARELGQPFLGRLLGIVVFEIAAERLPLLLAVSAAIPSQPGVWTTPEADVGALGQTMPIGLPASLQALATTFPGYVEWFQVQSRCTKPYEKIPVDDYGQA